MKYKWKIDPHPYNSDYDSFVTNDDDKALSAILYVAQNFLFDKHDGTETRSISVTRDVDVGSESLLG